MYRYLLSKKASSVIRAALIAVVLLTGTAQPPTAWAQSAELDAAFRQYKQLQRQGKYAEAIPFAQTFIVLAKEEFGDTHQHYALGLNNLALLYKAQGRYDEAEPLYKRALAIKEKALGPDHPHVALGHCQTKANRYPKVVMHPPSGRKLAPLGQGSGSILFKPTFPR